MKHYETAYSKFESVLYGATEQNGIVVEGQEIEAELRNVIELALDQHIHSDDPRLGIIPLILTVTDNFPAQAIPFNVIQEVITNYRSSHTERRSIPTATLPSVPGPPPSASPIPIATSPATAPPQPPDPVQPKTPSHTIYSASTGEAVGRSELLPDDHTEGVESKNLQEEEKEGPGSKKATSRPLKTDQKRREKAPEGAADMPNIGDGVTTLTDSVGTEAQEGAGDVEMVGEKAASPENTNETTGSYGQEKNAEAAEDEPESEDDGMEVDSGNEDRLILRIKKRKKDDDEYQDDAVSVDNDDYEAYLAKLRQTLPDKRRRLMEPENAAMLREGDDRPTYPSPEYCSDCVSAQEDCYTYVLPMKKGERVRKSCRRCYKFKKKCSFNPGKPRRKSRTPAVKMEEDEEFSMEEDENLAKNRKKRKRDKGKGRASVVKDEDQGLHLEWENTNGMVAGPSSGRRRRAPERVTDIAELFARLTAMENKNRRFQEETVDRLTEVEQDVDRVASDGKVQGEFLTQNLAKVQVQAEAAYQQSTATQAQVDSLRQQTDAITATMQSFNENATRTNEFLGGLMTRLERIRFDIGNSIDTWGSIRFGAIPGAPSTVQGGQLHQPELSWLKVEPAELGQPATPIPAATTPPPPQNISSTESSPSKAIWGEFMLSQSTEAGVPQVVENSIETDMPEPAVSIMEAGADPDDPGEDHRSSGVEGHITDDMYGLAVEDQAGERPSGEMAQQATPHDHGLLGIQRQLSNIEEVPEEPLSPSQPRMLPVASPSPVSSNNPPALHPQITTSEIPIQAPSPVPQDQPSTVTQADNPQSRGSPLNSGPHLGVPPTTRRSRSSSRARSPPTQGPMTRSRSSSLLKGSRPPRSKSSSAQP